MSPLLESRKKDLPQSGRAAWSHGMAAPIPLVEFSNDADTLGIGRPNRKADAGRAVVIDDPCAQLLVQPEVGAHREELQIMISENRRIAVRILDFVLVRHRNPSSGGQRDREPITEDQARAAERQ